MFVSKRRYDQLRDDYRQAAMMARYAKEEADFFHSELAAADRKLSAIKDYCDERSSIKNVSRPAILNLVATGRAKKAKRGDVLGSGEQLPLWD